MAPRPNTPVLSCFFCPRAIRRARVYVEVCTCVLFRVLSFFVVSCLADTPPSPSPASPRRSATTTLASPRSKCWSRRLALATPPPSSQGKKMGKHDRKGACDEGKRDGRKRKTPAKNEAKITVTTGWITNVATQREQQR